MELGAGQGCGDDKVEEIILKRGAASAALRRQTGEILYQVAHRGRA